MTVDLDLMELFRKSGRFEKIGKFDDFVFLAGPICQLTAFCLPSKREMMGRTRLDFYYGITVINSNIGSNGDKLEQNLRNRRFLALPRTIPVEHSIDMIISNEVISNWLVEEMLGIMRRYCLSSSDALSLIRGGGDKLVDNIRKVYGRKFDEIIIDPLLEIDRSVN